ncbi:hypothetical protein [Mesorhizobium sp. KR2-14]|uniref:hypothetical protein n=1 Tax=Mesorhizobium sp. KR2-14 TaxID=3156610 RepID=UPI0032B3E3E8
MLDKKKDPEALAGADRVDVMMLAGDNDTDTASATVADLQVRLILARYALSLPLALALAELAFSSGRRP